MYAQDLQHIRFPYAVVLVPEQVADMDDVLPRHLWLTRPELGGNSFAASEMICTERSTARNKI